MNKLRKLLNIAVSLCLILQLFSLPALAAQPDIYLALGDSISTGYGLSNPASGFVGQVSEYYGLYTPENRAINGNTAAGIYAQLESGELDDMLSAAGLITLTCGGNDLMAVLYAKIAVSYNKSNPKTPISPDEVTSILGGTHPTLSLSDLLFHATSALSGLASSQEFDEGLAAFTQSLTQVMEYIRRVNPTAHVIIPTQYNPYKSFSGHWLYGDVYTEIEPGVRRLNQVIKDNAAVLGYTVADVYTSFSDSSQNLCNAKAPLLGTPNLDFHPNAAGHAVLADVVIAAVPTDILGTEVLSDGTVAVWCSGNEGIVYAAAFDGGRMLYCTRQLPAADSSRMALDLVLSTSADEIQIFRLSPDSFTPLCEGLRQKISP